LGAARKFLLGDLTDQEFGLAHDEYLSLIQSTDSLIHCAASLNRKSEKQCPNREFAWNARK